MKQIIGATFGESAPGSVSVIVIGQDFYAFATLDADGLVRLEPGSYFSQLDFYGPEPRRFLAILGKFVPEVQELRKFIPVSETGHVAQADLENLFKWDREVRG